SHFVPVTRKLDISSGASLREHVVLREVSIAAPPPPPPVDQTGTLGGFLGPPATTPLGKAQLRQREPAAVPAIAVTPLPSNQAASDGDEDGSIFTRWWFWTAAAAVVAGGVTAALLVTRKGSDCAASTCSNF
ncbi:MAG TPA: hypothetical protein VHF26_22195, partial [Trebonia sp.]|nr:hypothetical protein [Trebonia sp.]